MIIEPEVHWESPPASARESRVNRLTVLRQCVANPMTWARLGTWTKRTTASQAASDARCGRTALTDPIPGEFEARVGEIDTEFGVWVRFVPAPSTNGKEHH